ncbi:MAG: Gfo/Idh/MocA family oxidoreductase [Planctomycetota bacterium]
MTEGTKVRLGLVGLGNQGHEHLEGQRLSEKVEFVAGFDVDRELSKRVCEEFGIRNHQNLESLLEDPEVEGLVLALAHHVYPKIWPDLVKSGKPILKEKPLGRNLAEATFLIESARTMGCPLVTAIQRREHESYRYLKESLGGQKVSSVSARMFLGFDSSVTPLGWRGNPTLSGGGILLDAGYHMVDLVQYFLGPITLVSAILRDSQGRPATPDILEKDAELLACRGNTWIRIACYLSGRTNQGGGKEKFEEVIIDTEEGQFRADRSHVWGPDGDMREFAHDWREAMARQLDSFGDRIQRDNFDDSTVWTQMPAMSIIENSYAQSRFLGSIFSKEGNA